MRRFFAVAFALMLIFALALGVSAESGATRMNYYATVASDGSCEVTVTTTLRLEERVESMSFPVPTDATDVTLNGDRVRTQKVGQARHIDLSNMVKELIGEFTFTVNYELADVINEDDNGVLMMTLPMLSGCNHSVELLEFSVTMPGNVKGKPSFSSGYHQTSIEQELNFKVDGAVITGSTLKSLKDQETLSMSLTVDEDMFPNAPVEISNAIFDDIAMGICAALALIYWLVFLRAAPVRRQTGPLPPAGYSAGEAGSVIMMQGMDLHLLVFSWAQLGYVLIQLDRNSRVLIHKRMEMGNERSPFEQKLFRTLFGKGQTVDTTSYRYAIMCKKARKLSPDARALISKSSGNVLLFRGLCAGIGLFGGIAIGIALGAGAIAQWFWVVVLAAAGAVSGWFIQLWAEGLWLQNKRPLWIGIALSVLWILLGIISGQILVGILMVAAELMAGLMAAFGGRRTLQGKLAQAQMLGLRHYLKTVQPDQLRRIKRNEPDYFHNMAPYALALGVDRAFASHFGSEKIDPCPYLTTGMDGHRTASEWSEMFRRALEAMGERCRRLPLEKLIRIIDSIRQP